MNELPVNPEQIKLLMRKAELFIGSVVQTVSDRIHDPKRLGIYFATFLLGLSASRLVSSIVIYILAAQIQSMPNPLASMSLANIPRQAAVSPNIDLASIIDGVFFKRAVVDSPSMQTGSPSQNFSLIGTLEGNPSFARAIIRIMGAQEEPKEYALGEKIGNAVLVVIGYEKIWVRENGVKYKIEVGENSQAVQSKAASTAPVDGGSQNLVISRQEINDKILGNPAAIYSGGAAFGPYVENGKIAGFRLARVPENHIFYTLGARSGDIVKSVNDYPLNNTGQMMELWNNIKTMPRVSVDLVRDGKNMRFNFEIRN